MDGTTMAMPGAPWNEWYPGSPTTNNCNTMTNYQYWLAARMARAMNDYVWLDVSCTSNPAVIQGYICEGTRNGKKRLGLNCADLLT